MSACTYCAYYGEPNTPATPSHVATHPLNVDATESESKNMARATSYIVLPYGGYPDDASAYKKCATRREVETMLPDYGWMNNPALHVFKVTKGESADQVIVELAGNPDPYPDFVVEFGPRHAIVWAHA